MYTIKQAARLTGVPETSLRAWERRYGLLTPRRNDAGHRLYDDEAVAVVVAMRRLVDAQWSPAAAAQAIVSGGVPASPRGSQHPVGAPSAEGPTPVIPDLGPFLESAARMDSSRIEKLLDQGFSRGSFEHVVDTWLFPTLQALGEAWARGEVDVAGEHLVSHAVQRRLSAAFNAAGGSPAGPSVVVGLPPGSHHELGALTFATALRRRGHDVLYLGADVPGASWDLAVRARSARAAVLGIVTVQDRPAATVVARGLRAADPALVGAGGGAGASGIGPDLRSLSPSVGVAVLELEGLLHQRSPT